MVSYLQFKQMFLQYKLTAYIEFIEKIFFSSDNSPDLQEVQLTHTSSNQIVTHQSCSLIALPK